eukprot:15364552-Ditylum_brightwellii.AAC.3
MRGWWARCAWPYICISSRLNIRPIKWIEARSSLLLVSAACGQGAMFYGEFGGREDTYIYCFD